MLEKLKEFVVRIVKDEEFRTDLENQPSEQAQTEVLEKLGYNFALPDVEAGAIEILELAEQGLFNDLNDGELAAVFGGLTTVSGTKPVDMVHASYGVSVPPTDEHPWNPGTPSPRPIPVRPWWFRHQPHKPMYQGVYGAPITRVDDATSK